METTAINPAAIRILRFMSSSILFTAHISASNRWAVVVGINNYTKESGWGKISGADDIDIVVHRQSVIHSLVEYCDNSVIVDVALIIVTERQRMVVNQVVSTDMLYSYYRLTCRK